MVAKGPSNRRAEALSRHVRRRDSYNDHWLGEVLPPINHDRPVWVFVKRRLKDDLSQHSYYVSTLSLPSKGLFMDYYDQRGGSEVEQLCNDKNGLNPTARRKQRCLAQIGDFEPKSDEDIGAGKSIEYRQVHQPTVEQPYHTSARLI